MFKTKKHPRLVVSAGNQLGKSYLLKKGEYSIGSHKKCRVKIVGEFVSELHALIEKNDDGVWVLTNNSPNGTYVNQRQVDAIELDRFSVIQIGTDNSFEFIPPNHREGVDPDAPEDGSAVKPKKKISKWPIIGGGVAMVYLPLFLYLVQLGDDIGKTEVPPILSLAAIESISSKSSEYLTGVSDGEDGAAISTGQQIKTGNSRGAYEKLVMGAYSSSDEKNLLVEQLIDKSKSYLTSAHHYIQMDMDKNAENSLRSAMSVVPDPLNPITGFAAKTISKLKEPKESKK